MVIFFFSLKPNGCGIGAYPETCRLDSFSEYNRKWSLYCNTIGRFVIARTRCRSLDCHGCGFVLRVGIIGVLETAALKNKRYAGSYTEICG